MDMRVHQRLLQKSSKSAFIGPSSLRMCTRLLWSVTSSNILGTFQEEMRFPWKNILEVDIFYVYGIGFMGPFHSSMGNKYILIVVDYVSKFIEAISYPINEEWFVINMFKIIISPRFDVLRLFIRDERSYVIAKQFENLLKKYEVRHRVATPYHSKTSGQVEFSNREIKNILENTASLSRKDWATKVDDALWEYWTSYKTLIVTTLLGHFMESHVTCMWN